MAHAQRLLPIEQLLSDVATSTSGPVRTPPRPALASGADARRFDSLSTARPNSVSPFAADSARKNIPKAETSVDSAAVAGQHSRFAEGPSKAEGAIEGTVRATQPAATSSANAVNMGSAALAVEELSPEPAAKPPALVESKIDAKIEANAESLRDAVLNALCNQQMLVSLLETAEWRLEGNTLVAKAEASITMIEMSFTADARRVGSAAASGSAGRPIRMQVEPGGAAQAAPARKSSSNGSARSRAEEDPIVRRMQEKFGAEIRTVIDYREKG